MGPQRRGLRVFHPFPDLLRPKHVAPSDVGVSLSFGGLSVFWEIVYVHITPLERSFLPGERDLKPLSLGFPQEVLPLPVFLEELISVCFSGQMWLVSKWEVGKQGVEDGNFCGQGSRSMSSQATSNEGRLFTHNAQSSHFMDTR